MKYDLIVVGAGPGGYVAAIKAAQLGMKVALVENDRVGGTCLNKGCIPTKTLLHSAETVREIKNASENGIKVSNLQINMEELYAKKNKVVDNLVQGIEGLVKANKIELIFGKAQVIKAGVIKIDETTYETKKIMIATGSTPTIPPIPGIDLPGVLTSNELLTEPNDYKKMTIIGGGVIGVEFAMIFNELGCEVTIIETAATLLPNFDNEISKKLALVLKKQGIKVVTKAVVTTIFRDQYLTCTYTTKGKENTVEADAILIATGRKSNFEGVFAPELNVKIENQSIWVDDYFETSIKGIYAIGDVASRGIQLAHLASAQGVNAVLAMNQLPVEYDLNVVPSCVYTTPEIASVGITETRAKDQNSSVIVGKYNMAGNGKTMIAGASLGFIKVIADAQSKKIIGAQLMCDRATDMISEFTTAIVNGLTINEVTAIIHPHPTYNEGIGEAYENLQGLGIHTIPKK
ncbi:dihydrolipoyl dehydrogenase [Enterococcus haemoperoxidus ATCC BAA-382]|uniref:Dihydrolipoyl dehydrogenase n=1 Tax=Enterococcus haemoperoxidus ATCC BAA-382 TaxID=1158608 RepID=R2QAE6_9ENTE|nr:dihydrolipoyl dehydrogenase [Enterococcus haemoperoxidus]EOH93382.1 dihydrolipoyl dehydrogenase [Enterococcus haemoperoxidus ATCC BAA-382]EOT61336.1 dihydrolipoyl dehydrogenase [Enterococcus haemoperoxidus ATCC BAA-382]OJG54518.1 dihydrolipoyl dehydrogenase [Enterococcus haemoperoxidus]